MILVHTENSSTSCGWLKGKGRLMNNNIFLCSFSSFMYWWPDTRKADVELAFAGQVFGTWRTLVSLIRHPVSSSLKMKKHCLRQLKIFWSIITPLLKGMTYFILTLSVMAAARFHFRFSKLILVGRRTGQLRLWVCYTLKWAVMIASKACVQASSIEVLSWMHPFACCRLLPYSRWCENLWF